MVFFHILPPKLRVVLLLLFGNILTSSSRSPVGMVFGGIDTVEALALVSVTDSSPVGSGLVMDTEGCVVITMGDCPGVEVVITMGDCPGVEVVITMGDCPVVGVVIDTGDCPGDEVVVIIDTGDCPGVAVVVIETGACPGLEVVCTGTVPGGGPA